MLPSLFLRHEKSSFPPAQQHPVDLFAKYFIEFENWCEEKLIKVVVMRKNETRGCNCTVKPIPHRRYARIVGLRGSENDLEGVWDDCQYRFRLDAPCAGANLYTTNKAR